MIRSIVFLPSPPLLGDPLAATQVPEIYQLRQRCLAAIAAATDTASQVEIIGVGPSTGELRSGEGEPSLAKFGLRVPSSGRATTRLPLEPTLPQPLALPLPLPHTIAAVLLDALDVTLPRRIWSITADAPAAEGLRLGAELAETDGAGMTAGLSLDPPEAGREPAANPVLLVIGDGTAARGLKAPRYLDPRADSFDAAVTDALLTTDYAELTRIDARLATELGCGGRGPWQVAAGYAMALAGSHFQSKSWYQDDPFGVLYRVITWRDTGHRDTATPRHGTPRHGTPTPLARRPLSRPPSEGIHGSRISYRSG